MKQISDTIKTSQSQIDELKSTLKKTQLELAEERKARQLAETDATYSRTRLQEITQSLSALQHRYETRMKQVHELKNAAKRTLTERSTDHQRHEKLQSENLALKDQHLHLQSDLTAARTALQSSTNPTIAELESARFSARTATSTVHRLETSLSNLRHDFDFTRSQYQAASTAAADSAAEVAELQARNEELERKASDERMKLAELNTKEARKMDLDRIEELEVLLRNREGVLRRVEEEVRVLGRGEGEWGW